ncbi:VapE domain-containing protein [Adonisia turfae]|uniref:Virulence-associated protein E-like domain-containing protein n=1 Tax=Adonisia turfae CCMR0081 TaxID=2292702 RepID=A0A6M0RZD1_9CYAN|nr:VapE domain-containing protein [Adonisia turfae]NEZ61011.1 hypothetical protein [Adonisia turfae CCMR0081]
MVDAESRSGQGATAQPQKNDRSHFKISDYLDCLQPDGGSETRTERSFFCPVCQSKNFKVDLKTNKYSGFNCKCTQSEASKRKLRALLRELRRDQKPVRPRQQRSWIYQDAEGRPLIRVNRQDYGNGKRKIWQDPIQKGACTDLRKLARPYRYQECLEAIERGEPIFWVEGEPCVDALHSIGITATTTIQGSNSYNSEQYRGLFPVESLVICPDRDLQGLKYAGAIAADYEGAKWCYAKPDSRLWQRLSASGGWDIADWIEEGATAEIILAAVEERRTFAAVTPEATKQADDSSTTTKPNAFKRQYHYIEQRYLSRLRFNEFTKDIELDKKPLDLGDFRVRLAVDNNLDVRLDNLGLILKSLAEKNPFHPVKDYLSQCVEQHTDTQILQEFAQRYFGCPEPIYNIFLKRTLIAAVARIFEPGCKVDTALILQGKQGYRKSTFFKLLAGEDYFDDSLGAIDKDEKLKLHQTWFAEWAELESVFKRKDISLTKAFLSSSVDVIRPPYGKQPQRMKRQAIIVGTTNQDEFLSDSTGNRRFWVIPVKQPIDVAQLRQERDLIWGAAVALYQAGEQWWLTAAEEQQAQELAKDYLTTDPWQSRIETYLIEARLTKVNVTEVLNNCFEIDPSQQTKSHQMRVAECLKRLSWESAQKKHHGKRQRVWVKPDGLAVPEESLCPTSPPNTTSAQPAEHKLDLPPNVDRAAVYGDSAQPAQPQTPSFVSHNGHGKFIAEQLE